MPTTGAASYKNENVANGFTVGVLSDDASAAAAAAARDVMLVER